MSAKSAHHRKSALEDVVSGYGRYLSLWYVTPALVVVALVGIVFGAIEIGNYINAERLGQHLTTVNGVVTDKSAGLANHGAATGTLAYEFALPDGSQYIHDAVVSPKFWDFVDKGSIIRVVYDNQNPVINYVDGFQPTTTKAKTSIVFSAGVSVLAIVALIYIRRVHKRSKLFV